MRTRAMIGKRILFAILMATAISNTYWICQVNCQRFSLLENFARDIARNRVLHILRHFPDLLNEVLQMQQAQMQIQLMQQQQQQNFNQGSINQPGGQQGTINGFNSNIGGSSQQQINSGQQPLIDNNVASNQVVPTQNVRRTNSQFGIIV